MGQLQWREEKPSFHWGFWETIVQVSKLKCHFKKKKLLDCSIFFSPIKERIISINKNLMIAAGLVSSLKENRTKLWKKINFRSLARAWLRGPVGRTTQGLTSWATRWQCSVAYFGLQPLRGAERTWTLCDGLWKNLTTIVQATNVIKQFQLHRKVKQKSTCF